MKTSKFPETKERVACKAAPASGGASERVPAPVAPFLLILFKSSCGVLRFVASLGHAGGSGLGFCSGKSSALCNSSSSGKDVG